MNEFERSVKHGEMKEAIKKTKLFCENRIQSYKDCANGYVDYETELKYTEKELDEYLTSAFEDILNIIKEV